MSTPTVSAIAPIERVTIPLTPRTPSGCCDLAVMYYGRYVQELLRIFAAVVLPAALFVYGFGLFVGTDASLALMVGLIVSKPLGLLTVASVARTTFGEPFELAQPSHLSRRTRLGRLRELTRSILTAAAIIALAAIVIASFDDAYGTGRLTAFGPRPAAAIVILIAAVVAVRSGLFIADVHQPGRSIQNGFILGTFFRTLLAIPLFLLFFEETRTAGIFVAICWLPIVTLILLARSFENEQRALTEIDPSLLQSISRSRALSFSDRVGPAITVTFAAACLGIITLFALESCISLLGLAGPISGPASDYLDSDSFDFSLAYSAVTSSPLFAATTLIAALFAYQLGRIAWFFTYIDARVRSDCWDMELLLAREAKRLEGE